MSLAKKIKFAVVVIIALVAGVFAVNYYRQPGYHPETEMADWVCLEEGHAFVARPPANDWHERRCPTCGSHLARVFMYYNVKTGTLSELYREAVRPDASVPPDYEDFVVKTPDSQWRQKDSELELATGFPVVVPNSEDLRYAGPGSSYRK